ncbi:MAG: MFS transporter [Actinomycetota bacterium]
MTETRIDEAPSGSSRLGGAYYKLFASSTISNVGDGIGTIAYPWLASAVTRNGLLIALVVVVQRLPWLLFSLPAGVITDRYDRRTLMIQANWLRTVLTLFVSFAVLNRQGGLLSPDELDAAASPTEDLTLYGLLLVATLLLGMAEVLYDNAAQTFMPAVVPPEHLERANGRLWSAEMVANTFIGPPLAAALLVVAFSVPFFVDAASFAVAAVLITLILPRTMLRSTAPAPAEDRRPWKEELAEGFRWLWGHDLFRPMAVILGFLNLLGTLSMATLVLYGQEVLGTSPTEFAILSTGGAVGGVIGGWTASKVADRIGSGPSLGVTLLGGAFIAIAIGLTSQWPVVWALFAAFMFTAVLWNVITVSLRQTVIPDELLGRVNSVYRFFAWGMMPLGALLAGAIISVGETVTTRETALRLPWLVAGVAHFFLYAFARPRLTTEKMERARAEALADREAADG